MTHVKHMNFELELKHDKIVRALAWVPKDQRATIIFQLYPTQLRRAVAETLGIECPGYGPLQSAAGRVS